MMAPTMMRWWVHCDGGGGATVARRRRSWWGDVVHKVRVCVMEGVHMGKERMRFGLGQKKKEKKED